MDSLAVLELLVGSAVAFPAVFSDGTGVESLKASEFEKVDRVGEDEVSVLVEDVDDLDEAEVMDIVVGCNVGRCARRCRRQLQHIEL